MVPHYCSQGLGQPPSIVLRTAGRSAYANGCAFLGSFLLQVVATEVPPKGLSTVQIWMVENALPCFRKNLNPGCPPIERAQWFWIFETSLLFRPSAPRTSNPRLNTLKQGLWAGEPCICLLLREVRLASVNIDDLSGLHRRGAKPKFRKDRMIAIFVGHLAALKDAAAFPLLFRVSLGKLRTFLRTDLENPTKVGLCFFGFGFPCHIAVLTYFLF